MGTFGTPSSYNNTGALGSATNPTTAQGLSRDRENQKAILELPGTQAWVEKTITDGVIIPTSAEIIVLPEGGASTDSLTTIALTSDGTTTLHEGMTIRLKAANSNTITVVHGTGTNNISTIDGNNVVLDTTWYLELKLINGLWVQQETSASKAANEAKTSATGALAVANGAYVQFAASTSASSEAAKVVTLSGYKLKVGSVVSIVFSNANTVEDAITLNVNGTGAKSVYNQTGVVSASNTALFAANQPIEFRYDGTGWVSYDVAKVTTPLLAGKANVDLSNATGNAFNFYLHVRDRKAQGTVGGSTGTNAWATRDLNALENNTLTGASLASNRITLPAGTYLIKASVPAFGCNAFRAALYDYTNSAYLKYGSTAFAAHAYNVMATSNIFEKITLASPTTIELRMWSEAADSQGMGIPSNTAGAQEIYSEVYIWKM